MRHCGIRTVMIMSVLASAACLAGIALLQPDTPTPVLLGVLALSGIFRSTGLTAYNSLAFADVEPARMAHATPLFATLQELGAGIGVAIAALLVRRASPIATHLGLTSGSGPFRVTFILLIALLVFPLTQALRLPRTAACRPTTFMTR